MTIKELIASKLRPIANAVRTKSGKTELIPVDDLEDEIYSILTDKEAQQKIIDIASGNYEGEIDLSEYHTLRDGAFSNNKITNVIIGENITTLPQGCFKNNQITEIEIPETVEKIYANAIQSNPLTKVIFHKDLIIENNGLKGFGRCDLYFKGTLSDWINKTWEQYTNPLEGNNLYYLYNDEFYKLENLIIPDGVTKIGDWCFYGSSIKSITFSDSVLEIGENSFSRNILLTELIIPDTVTQIKDDAFKQCSNLKSVVIGKNVTTINYGAFMYCSNIEYVEMKGTTPPKIELSVFQGSYPIYVPKGTKETYLAKTGWSTYSSRVMEPNNVSISVPSSLLNNDKYTYSIDGGLNYNQFTNESLSFVNLTGIKLKNTDADTTILIGTTEGGSDIGTIANAELTHATESDQTIYLTVA